MVALRPFLQRSFGPLLAVAAFLLRQHYRRFLADDLTTLVGCLIGINVYPINW
jgi:hypothetical protein